MTVIPQIAARQMAGKYLDDRKSMATPISTNHALRALKLAMPACGLTDRELVNIVAELALARGRSIHFDVSTKASST